MQTRGCGLFQEEEKVFQTRVHLIGLFRWHTSVLFMIGLAFIVLADIYYLTDQLIVFLAVIALLLILLILFNSFMYWFKSYAIVTNHRILYSIGWLNPYVREISMDRISDISVGQGFLGRMLNFGTIYFNQDKDVLLPLSMISRPYEFRHHVMSSQKPICGKGI